MTSDTAPARTAYEAWAATYDIQVNATRDLDAAVLRGAGLPLEGQAVIEIGAGTGKNTAYLAEHARSVLALDLSPAMLARARERVPGDNVRSAEHDITRSWPAGDGGADIVVGNLVLEHVADLRPVLAEAHRVLRPGGLLFLCELHPYRQLCGAQAQFDDGRRLVLAEAYPHAVSDYVNAALDVGFDLARLDEWRDAQAGSEHVPPYGAQAIVHAIPPKVRCPESVLGPYCEVCFRARLGRPRFGVTGVPRPLSQRRVQVVVSGLAAELGEGLPGGALQGGGPTPATAAAAAGEPTPELAQGGEGKMGQSAVGQGGGELVELGWE